jgi:hypothetical protein
MKYGGVIKAPTTKLPTLQNGGDTQTQGYKDTSPYNDEPYIDIFSNNITMDGVSIPLYAQADTGETRILPPNSGTHYFPGASVVRETPMAQNGGRTVDFETLKRGIRYVESRDGNI